MLKYNKKGTKTKKEAFASFFITYFWLYFFRNL